MMAVEVKAYYKYQLAGFYGVKIETFNKWIQPYIRELTEEHGYNTRQYLFTPNQVQFIFDKIGEP